MQECKPDFPGRELTSAEADIGFAPEAGTRQKAATPSYFAGAAWAIFAISIWSGWFVSTRFDISSGLSAYDLVMLRFGVAALILLPVSIRLRAGLGLLSWQSAAALFAGSGVIYSLCTTAGVAFAPVAEGAALTPGVMPMATALLSVLLLRERLSKGRLVGLCLILTGVIVIAGAGLLRSANGVFAGHVLFVTGAFFFAGYTIALRQSGLTGMEAAALVSLWSTAIYLPIYIFALHPRLLDVPVKNLVFPALYQGVLTNVVSLIAFARAVAILGPSRAASFAALIPAVTAILGIALLNERPALADWVGIAFVSAGVYLASGAPFIRLSGRRQGQLR